MKQTRLPVHAVKQSIYLYVYGYILDKIEKTEPMQYQPVTSWGKACSKCIHRPVMSWTDHDVAACTFCMGSKVSSSSQIYLYSSYFAHRLYYSIDIITLVVCLQSLKPEQQENWCLSKTSYNEYTCCTGNHRHLSNIDCLAACTACLVCFISTVNGCSQKEALKDWR